MNDAGLVHFLGESGHVFGCRIQDYLVGRVHLFDGAVLHDGDPVGEAERLVKIVGDENDRLAKHVLEAQELVLHFTSDQGIQRAEGLVQKPDVRLDREAAGNPDPLLLPAGEFPGKIVFAPVEPDKPDHFKGAFAPRMPVLPAHLERKGDVFKNGAVRQQSEGLEHHPHLRAPKLYQLGRVQAHDVLTVDPDRSAGDVVEARETTNQRRLAGARQPHDDEHLALGNLERDVLYASNVSV